MGHGNLDLALCTLGQGLRQQARLRQFSVEQYQLCGRHILVKLREEAGEYLVLAHLGDMRGEERAVPPILPATDEECLYSHHAIAVRQRKNVGVANALRVDRLRPLYEGQRLQPVAQHRGTFEIKRLRRALHFRGKLRLHA